MAELNAATVSVVLLVSMDTAGRIIGKRGRNVADLQVRSGAQISLANGGGALPGMRCGDRLLEVSGDSARVTEGLRLVFESIAELPSTTRGDLGADSTVTVAMLVPSAAVGYIIGKGGRNVQEMAGALGCDVSFDKEGPLIAGSRVATLRGAAAPCAKAAMLLAAKAAETQSRETVAPAVRPFEPASFGAGGITCEQVPIAASFGHAPYGGPAAGQMQPLLAAERAVLAGIQASGIFDHRLSISIPKAFLPHLGLAEIAQRSGARLEVSPVDAASAHCFVTVLGLRLSTSLAVLHLQARLAQLNGEMGMTATT